MLGAAWFDDLLRAFGLALAMLFVAGLLGVALTRVRFGYARTRLLERLEAEMCRAEREGRRVALVILRYPDRERFGLPLPRAGRGVLDSLKTCFRAYDHIERIGPAEFAVILGLTEDVREGVVRERLVKSSDPNHRFRVRVGLSRHPEDGVTPQILLDHAVRHSA